MAEAQETVAAQEAPLFGAPMPSDDVLAAEEEGGHEPASLTELFQPEESEETVSVEEGATAPEKASPEAHQEDISVVDAVTQHLQGEPQETPDRTAELEREISTLQARWQEKESMVDKLIAAKEPQAVESEALSIQEQLASPEVARLIKDAQDSEDEAALPRLMVALAEKVADSKIDSETKDLRAEVEQIKQHSANEGDVANRRQHMLYALKQLERMGGTERALAVQMANDSENSLLWRKLSETPAITLDHKLMVDSGMALARAVEMAGAAIEQGKGEQPASQEVVREASTTARPRASNRGQDLNQQPEQVDEADAIMKNILLGSGGSLTDSVFS